MEKRKQQFKKGVDQDESRRRREATSVQIRKDKKEDSLQKRRAPSRDAPGPSGSGPRSDVGALPDPSLKSKLESLPLDVELLRSADPAAQLDATMRFRKLLSIERNPPIAEVIAAGVVPRLVQFLQCYDNMPLVFEAAWALTNVSSGTSEHTRVVIDNGAIPIFVHLLRLSSSDVQEQAVWALGNIAGDSPRCRDLVLSYGLLPVLAEQLNASTRVSMLRNSTWTISNMCRGKPPPRWGLVALALPLLQTLIFSTDEEVLVDACWALSYLSEPPDRVQAVIDAGALPRIVELLGHVSPLVQTPALRVLGNVATGSAQQTQALLECDGLSRLGTMLHSSKKEVRKEACWIVSNITAGPLAHVQSVCTAGLVPRLVELSSAGREDFEVRKEAVYALCNACGGDSAQVLSGLVASGVVQPFSDLLECADASLLLAVLEALEALLGAGAAAVAAGATEQNACAVIFDEVGGLPKLEALQSHQNEEVYKKAVSMLDAFFGAEEDDAALAPPAHAEGFAFGLAAAGATGAEQAPMSFMAP